MYDSYALMNGKLRLAGCSRDRDEAKKIVERKAGLFNDRETVWVGNTLSQFWSKAYGMDMHRVIGFIEETPIYND